MLPIRRKRRRVGYGELWIPEVEVLDKVVPLVSGVGKGFSCDEGWPRFRNRLQRRGWRLRQLLREVLAKFKLQWERGSCFRLWPSTCLWNSSVHTFLTSPSTALSFRGSSRWHYADDLLSRSARKGLSLEDVGPPLGSGGHLRVKF